MLLGLFVMSDVAVKQRIAGAFSQAAVGYDEVSELQVECGKRLLGFAEPFVSSVDVGLAVDVGCGTGLLGDCLKVAPVSAGKVLGVDLSLGMLGQARGLGLPVVCGDMECLPLGDGCADLVFSNFSCQWALSFAGFVDEVARALCPDGLLVLAIPVDNSLHELRSCWARVDSFVHVNSFLSAEAVEDVLRSCGFSVLHFSVGHSTLKYVDLSSLRQHLKAMGAWTVVGQRRHGLVGRQQWLDLQEAYEGFRCDGFLPLSFDVVYVVARK